MNHTYEFWKDAALAGTYDPISPERIDEMFTATCKYGSGNCWTGTGGTLAAMIRELLRERAHLMEQIDATYQR